MSVSRLWANGGPNNGIIEAFYIEVFLSKVPVTDVESLIPAVNKSITDRQGHYILNTQG